MINIFIIENSHFLSSMLVRILDSDPEIKVIDKSNSAEEAIQKVERLKPDVILLDIEMPGINSLDILHEIMRINPTPTIVFGPKSELGKREMISAFSYGALDFIIRPENPLEIEEIKDELIALVKVAASVEIKKLIIKRPKKPVRAPKISEKVVVIGASSGGVAALESLLSKFPRDFPAAVLVVQHMPAGFTEAFAERLDAICPIKVEEAKNGSRLERGKVLVAPGGYNLEIKVKGKHLFTRLNKKHTDIKPCIDVTLKSVAEACDGNVIAVILTGMGKDGADGVKWVKKNNGKVIAQDESTSLIFGMPRAVIENGDVDFVLPLPKIADKIAEIL